MQNPNITKNIRYIGADDHSLDLFESQYPVPNGVSYNSYIILDDQIAVMDTVDKRASETWLQNLRSALDGRAPDYLIISHMEPDHAANIDKAAQLYPQMKLVGSAKTAAMLPQFFSSDFSGRFVTVWRGGHALPGPAHASVPDGAHGALAGGHGCV